MPKAHRGSETHRHFYFSVYVLTHFFKVLFDIVIGPPSLRGTDVPKAHRGSAMHRHFYFSVYVLTHFFKVLFDIVIGPPSSRGTNVTKAHRGSAHYPNIARRAWSKDLTLMICTPWAFICSLLSGTMNLVKPRLMPSMMRRSGLATLRISPVRPISPKVSTPLGNGRLR